jgi:hypothetical protein
MLGHGSVMVTSVAMAVNGYKRWPSRHVVREAAAVDWKSLQSHQSLADLSIRRGINLSALGITEKLIQGIEVALSVIIGSMLTNISSVADRIINGTVRSWLLRSVVRIVSGVVRSSVISS